MHNLQQKSPLFSIAIPTYNRLEFLKRAVASSLAQTYQNFEVVIINNASTDGTKEWLDQLVIREDKIKIVHQVSNVGFVVNVKSILQHIRGEYLVVLSDDDWLEPEFVTWAVKDFLANENAVLWYCRARLVDLSCDELSRLTKLAPANKEVGVDFIKQCLMGSRDILFCSTVYKVDTLKKIGGFVGNTTALDYSAWCLCAAHGVVIFNSNVLSNYCLHSQNTLSTFSINEWFATWQEVTDLIVGKLGKSFRYYCACQGFLCFENFFRRYKKLQHKWKYFCMCYRKYPIFFTIILIKRFPMLLIKLLPDTWYQKIHRIRYGNLAVAVNSIAPIKQPSPNNFPS